MTIKTDKNSNAIRAAAPSQSEQLPTDTNPSAKRINGFDQITERIVSLLSKGTIPWHKPWQIQNGLPRNLISKKTYRGINVFLLSVMSYESPYWLTYRQAIELGGNIRKGEKGCPVVFWKQLEIDDKETGETEKIPVLRFYHVFNIEQCEGLKNISAIERHAPVMVRASEIVEHMPQRPIIKHGMIRAFYSPSEDFVGMPLRERFTSEHEYFATLFHELVHATGNQSRLNRATLTDRAGFGSNPYCKEELIAELGAAFLCGQAGIAESTINNSAAYIQCWLKELRNDRTLIVQAASQAQKAADFILGTQFAKAESTEQEATTD